VASIEETTLPRGGKFKPSMSSHPDRHARDARVAQVSGKTRKGGASIVNFSSVGDCAGQIHGGVLHEQGCGEALQQVRRHRIGALRYNIRVNSVHPVNRHRDAEIDDGALRRTRRGASVKDAEAGIISQHPIGRMGKPEELGGGVVYLCSTARVS